MFLAEVLKHATPVAGLDFDLASFCADPLEAMSESLPVLCPTDQENRELRIACRCIGGLQGELIDQPIDGRAEVVGDLADGDSPVVQRRKRVYANAVRVLAGVRIQLPWDDLILGLSAEGFLSPSESYDLSFCTPYLEARAIQRVTHA